MWGVSDDVSDRIVELPDTPVAARVRLLFEVYREMPSYWLIHKVEWLAKEMKEEDWDAVWAGFREALSDESPEQADPAAFALWCGLFEDQEVAPRAWRALATAEAPDRMMKRLLSVSGPVPWEAKVETYRRLSNDSRWHSDLAEALRLCYADVLGKNDAREALVLFSRMQLAPNTVAGANAASVIKELKRGVAHYRDRGGSSHGA